MFLLVKLATVSDFATKTRFNTANETTRFRSVADFEKIRLTPFDHLLSYHYSNEPHTAAATLTLSSELLNDNITISSDSLSFRICRRKISAAIRQSTVCHQRFSDMNSSEAEYEPVMSFWIDTDGYTDRDREMFVCGVEFQMIYETIKNKRYWCQCIHAENESRIRMMCARLGVPVKMERSCDTWTHCEIPASPTF